MKCKHCDGDGRWYGMAPHIHGTKVIDGVAMNFTAVIPEYEPFSTEWKESQ